MNLARLSRRVRIQLAIFVAIVTAVAAILCVSYLRLPAVLGIGTYNVTVQLTQTGGIYESGNVTYRGYGVGRVTAVRLTHTGAEATLRLNSSVRIPADVRAEVHSMLAVGEQYIDLSPKSENGPWLKGGDVISAEDTSVPPDLNSLLSATVNGLKAIPKENVKTVIDEGYTAVGGLGPELSRLVTGATKLASESRKNIDSLVTLIDESKPVLDSQINTSDSIQAWASHMATVTSQLKANDASVQGLLQNGGPALAEAQQLVDRLQLTLPIVLANLVSVNEVAIAYRGNIEQILVLLPIVEGDVQAALTASANTKQGYVGISFGANLNLNLPPPCTTGFLPAQQRRSHADQDYPPRPEGNLYCRVPQDSMLVSRGARNYPCATRPGKRAPTVKQCESDKDYVPLNDGFNWKGDQNATLSGQSVPELDPPAQAPAQEAAPPPVAAAHYDPATGNYVGPDGRLYTQSDLAQTTNEGRTWQSMLIPPTDK